MRPLFAAPCRLLACLLICLVFIPTSSCLAETWREVQSPHFRVVTDGSERQARDVAREFEQMRSIFEVRFPHGTVDTAAPLLIVAVDVQGLHQLSPRLWKDREKFVGEFYPGWERRYAMVRLDAFGDLNEAVIFHEYAHSILHANIHWMPLWLDEGLAEFYAYTRFQGDRVYLGAPSIRMDHLRRENLIPIPEVMLATPRSLGNDVRHNDLLYGESWAMVHYMTFGPGMGGGAKLNSFIGALEKGTSQKEAFQQVFGDPKAFEDQLRLYVQKFSVLAARFPAAEKLDASAYSTKTLTATERDYELGSFEVGVHDVESAKTRLQAAATADPALSGPHEELGFLAWRAGKDDEAKVEWQKAVAADPERYRSAFALLMTGMPLREQSHEQLAETLTKLQALHEKAPKFAPILVEEALIQWRLGQMNPAYQSAYAAEKLEPWRAGYHLLVGYTLLNGHQPKVAEGYARTVAARWPGSDHDEAADLWSLLPADAKGDGPPLSLALPSDATVVRGTIVSTACEKAGLKVVVQPGGGGAPLNLAATGRFESGFSDTLWVGEDHYTNCYHLGGLPAVVAYKAGAGGVNSLVALEVRDDLPASKPAEAAAKPAPTSF